VSGLAFELNFKSTRVLSDIVLTHINQAQMTYLGLYGQSATETLLNRSKGDLVTPTAAHGQENWVLGSNYLSSAARDLSAGINSSGQPLQLDSTIFCAFNAGATDFTSGTASHTYVSSLWGTLANTQTYSNPGRLSISLTVDGDGTRYIAMKWGTGANVPSLSCAVKFDWTTATTPILVIGSRNSAGAMALEVRANGQTLKASANVTPVSIPTGTSAWRMYTGLLSSQPVSDLRVYSSAAWASYLSPDELSQELSIMAMNLSAHLSN